jgi:hypothetical protein
MACGITNEEYIKLSPVNHNIGVTDPIAQSYATFWNEPYERALNDSRYKGLVETLEACLKPQGFRLESENDGDFVHLDPNWSGEQELAAILAAAKCADDNDLAQQAANIEATYQEQVIAENQAELNESQQSVTDRVARAESILREHGLM